MSHDAFRMIVSLAWNGWGCRRDWLPAGVNLADGAAVFNTRRRDTRRPTGFHKFYSETRSAWVSTETLIPGENLRSLSGPITLVSLAPVPGVHRVYNMTVEDDHVYYVSPLRRKGDITDYGR